MAFVMVLGALTILTVMLAEVQDESSAEFSGALSARDALIAEYAAKSAVNLSRLLLASEPTVRTALTPVFAMMGMGMKPPQVPIWRFADRMLGPFNDAGGAEAFTGFSGLDLSQGKNLGLPGAAFELQIVDEDSKINLNNAARSSIPTQLTLMSQLMAMMARPELDPLFESRDRDGNFSDRQTICSAIIDWTDSADPDTTTLCDPNVTTNQEMPAEDTYYELLPRRYSRKNGAFDSLEELRRVRGVGDDFWSAFVEPDPDNPEKRQVTVWGVSGAVNINTATPMALRTLVCSVAEKDTRVCTDPLEAAKFIQMATFASMFTMGAPPFRSAQAFVNALQGKGKGGDLLKMMMEMQKLEPIKFKSDAEAVKQMTVESKVFSIYAVGVVKGGKRETRVQAHAVVDFRGAPPPGESGSQPTGSADDAASPSAGAGAAAGTGTGSGVLSPDALQKALAPNPGGNVVYFRLD